MLSFPAPLEPAGERLAWVLLHFIWQGFAVAGLLALLLVTLSPRRAAVRHGLGVLALAILTVCPVVTWLALGPAAVPVVERTEREVAVSASRERERPEDSRQPPVAHAPGSPNDAPGSNSPLADAPGSPVDVWRTAAPWVVSGWLLGVAVLSLRLLVSVVAVARLRLGCRPLPDDWPARVVRLAQRLGFHTPPTVGLSARAAQALATGVLRPLVLLPAAWVTELPPDVLEAVIAHELAHLRRWDLWINLWLRVVETVLFYHPAVWWLSRRLRVEREMCCDELAAGAAGGRAAVARALEAVARLGLSPVPPAALATLIGGEPMSLLARIRYLLGQAPAPRPAGRWLAGLLALCVPVATWLAAGQPAVPSAELNPDETAVGVVVDSDGKPVAGIDVKAFRQCFCQELPNRFRSDEQGRIRVPAIWVRADHVEGDDLINLIARDADGRVGWHDFGNNRLQAQMRGAEPFRIVMLPLSRDVRGTMVDSNGQPVAGVQLGALTISQPSNRNSGYFVASSPGDVLFPPGVTNAQGRFSMKLPPDSVGELSNRHPDFGALRIRFTKEVDDLGRIQMPPGGRVAGRVTDARTGQPCAGVHAFAKILEDDATHVDFGITTTDADGRFQLSGLQLADYRIGAGKLTDPTFVVTSTRVQVTAGRGTTVELHVITGRVVSGTVLDSQTGAPVPNCNVSCCDEWCKSQRTDARGQFRFHVAPGTYQVSINDSRRGQPLTDSRRTIEVSADRDPDPLVLKAGPLGSGPRGRQGRIDQPAVVQPPAPKPDDTAVGVVVDVDGKPVAGLEVIAHVEEQEQLITFRTDEQGRIRVPSHWVRSDPRLGDKQVQLTARDAGRLGWHDFARLTAEAQKRGAEPFRITLQPLTRLVRGTFVDTQGQPVAGVPVYVRTLTTDTNGWGLLHSDEPLDRFLPPVVSDAEGRFTLRLPPDSSSELRNQHPDFVALRLHVKKGQDDLGRIELAPAGRVAGRVTDARTGRPIAGAIVHANGQGRGTLTVAGYGVTRTDADGRFAIASLPTAGYRVRCTYPADTTLVTQPSLVRVSVGQVTNVALTLAPGRVVTGTVVDAQTGKPVPQCLVTVDGDEFAHGHADADGRFRYYLPPGDYRAYIADGERQNPPDSMHNFTVPADRDPAPIVLKAGSPTNLKRMGVTGGITFVPLEESIAAEKDMSYKLRITLRTPDNRPVTEVLTWSAPEGYDTWSLGSAHRGDAFAQHLLSSWDGQRVTLVIEAKGFARPTAVTVTVAKTMAPVTVDLQPAELVTVRGRVFGPDGQPLARAHVRVGLSVMGKGYETPWGTEPITDAEGRYELKHLRAGDRFRIEATKEGLSRAVSPRLTVERGTPLTVPDLTIGRPEEAVSGTVVDPSGRPVANARVYVLEPTPRETRTDAAGQFRLTGLPAGKDRIWVDGAGFQLWQHYVPPGQKTVEFQLNRLDANLTDFRLQVRLKPRGGTVKRSKLWLLRQGPPPSLTSSTSFDGDTYDWTDERTFGREAGKTFVLIVEPEGFVRPKPVAFVAGKTMPPVEIDLEPAAAVSVRGRVVDPDGKPIAGVLVGLSKQLVGEERDEPWRWFSSREPLPLTDADGRFEQTGLAVGTHFAVKVGTTGTAGAWSEWRTVEKSGDVTLPDLVLRPATGMVAGTVVDANGKAVTGAKVEYRDRFGRAATVTDARGAFRLEGLPDGKVFLFVDDRASAGDVVTVGATDIHIALRRDD